MQKLSILAIIFLLFKTIGFAEVREPQRMDRIVYEVTKISSTEISFVDETRKPPEKKSWIKRHPVIAGTLIGFGIGAGVGQIYSGDLSVLGKVVYFGGIGAGIGALSGLGVKVNED